MLIALHIVCQYIKIYYLTNIAPRILVFIFVFPTMEATLFRRLFLLALAWGYLIQHTDNICASVLFLAGMEAPIIPRIFTGL